MKDSEITEQIYSALRKRYGDSKRFITACEVGNSTGVYQSNRLDFVAMEIWPSDSTMEYAVRNILSQIEYEKQQH